VQEISKISFPLRPGRGAKNRFTAGQFQYLLISVSLHFLYISLDKAAPAGV